MANYIVVIGTSAGGLTPLKTILNHLPQNFAAPILITKHLAPKASLLPPLLRSGSSLPIHEAYNGQLIMPGEVYVSAPDYHMTLSGGKISLKMGAKINHSRPAIDPLFCSAAEECGPFTIGILLSGMLDDGSAGMLAIKEKKGITIIQDLDEAEYKDMPNNASHHVTIDYCLPAAQIAELLIKLVMKSTKSTTTKTPNPLKKMELKMNPVNNDDLSEDMNEIGKPSPYSCPACNGVLWKIKDERIERYRCRVGHTYGVSSLMEGFEKSTENALWAALRALEEKESLAEKILLRAAFEKSEEMDYFSEKVKKIKQHINIIRDILNRNE